MPKKVTAASDPPFELAEFRKVERMYAHLEDLLLKIGFLDPEESQANHAHPETHLRPGRPFGPRRGDLAGNFPPARMVRYQTGA